MKAFSLGVAIGLMAIISFRQLAITVHNNYKVEGDLKVDKNIQNFVKNFSVKKLVEDEVARRKHEQIKAEIIKSMEVVEQKEREKEQVVVSRGDNRSVPSGNTAMKSYMDYRKITNKASAQYKLQQRDDIYTDSEGFRKIGDRFIVAVGTYYGKVGTELRIELENGNTFRAIIGDLKSDKHTESTNRQHAKDGSVVEFVVDVKRLDGFIKKMGDCSHSGMNNFKGNVVNIVVLSN